MSKLGKFTLMKAPECRQKQRDYSMMDKAQKENICGWHTQKQRMKWSCYTIECFSNFEQYTFTLLLLQVESYSLSIFGVHLLYKYTGLIQNR